MFLFQDDLFRSDCVARMVKAASDRLAIFVCCQRDFAFFPEVSNKFRNDFLGYTLNHNVARYFPNQSWVTAPAFRAQLAMTPMSNFIGEPTAVLLHSSALEKFGRFHGSMTQLVDFEYWARIAVQVGMGYVDEPLITFRMHGKSATSLNADAAIRVNLLDDMVMLHDFIHAPAYASLRRSPKNWVRLYRHYSRLVGYLKQGSGERWQAALDRYPELRRTGLLTPAVMSATVVWGWLRRLKSMGRA